MLLILVTLTLSMRQKIITCIPKGNKNYSLITNWCPISLLPVVYKMASSVSAERLKPILKDIILTHQIGVLSGRSISDCTRLIYDLMFYTQKHKIPGLLMQIDFKRPLILFRGISYTLYWKSLALMTSLSSG